jgi:SAM-dependent methyltransferase
MSQANDILRQWQETAKHWTRYSDTIREMFMPLTEALMKSARIAEGQSVLDVAGGAGEPSLTIAERVGPTGSVTCTDAIAEMVEAARRAATSRGITNVQFQQCTAESLPFTDESFDVVVSRLGVMLFPDPLAAFVEMLRVLKPGGTIALIVWHKNELNPFCHIVSDVVSRHVPTPPADPDGPGAFRFAAPGKLANMLTEAGAANVAEEILHFNIHAPISPEQFWTMRSETSDTLRVKLAALPEPEKLQVAQEVQHEVGQFFPNNQMNFPALMIMVTGKKPS